MEQKRTEFRPLSQNLCDKETALKVANRIFGLYDEQQKGILGDNEARHMMRDAYRYINKQFDPSDPDVDSYLQVIDVNQDGKVTIEDI